MAAKTSRLEHLKSPPRFKSANFVLRRANFIDMHGRQQNDQTIVVRGGHIISIAPGAAAVPRGERDVPQVDVSGYLILPGLINGHTHVALSYLRGLSHSRPNMIEDLFFATEQHLTAKLVEALSYGYLYDGLRSGVTCFVDHYYHIEGVGRALERLGLRGVLAETLGDLGTAFPDRDGKRFAAAIKLINRWPFDRDFIRPVLGPHAADTASAGYLRKLADFARADRLPVHMHVAQTFGEHQRVEKRDGVSPVRKVIDAGLVGEQSLLVHCVSADSDDVARIAGLGASIGFCPASQMIYEKLAPLELFAKERVLLCVATDCAPSNDGADMLAELRLTGLLGQNLKKYENYFTPQSLWRMATTNPAKVFGLKHLGSIAPGKAADLVFVRDDLLNTPAHEPLTNLIYGMGSRNVEHVMVGGAWRLWQRTLCGVDIKSLTDECMHATRKILSKSKIKGAV